MSPIAKLSLAAACALWTLPALAAPVHITVPGGTFDYSSPSSPYFVDPLDNYSIYSPDQPYDPVEAAVERNVIVLHQYHTAQPLNPELAAALIRNGESYSQHWARCAAHYATYELAGDTYVDGRGVPQPCRL
ncbi:MAG TPA: hypothetical protein VHZ56_10610 [Devosia sp.]|jgi:hypothetical protein|nr:hypothetical protein [Devosia sp.]